MKTLILIFSIVLTVNSYSQIPQKVYSIVKELKEEEWYKTQGLLWEKEVKSNPKNAEAWYNYYSAYRALRNINHHDRELVSKYSEICQKIADDAYKEVPDSFEANHLIWWHSFSDPDKFSYLERAYNINPHDMRTYRDMMTHYALIFNTKKVEEFATKILNVNEMPAESYNWAYNMLMELDSNAIILTAGDNDTYLPWIVQNALGIRKDVTVLNTSLLTLDDYRDKVFKKMNIPTYSKKMTDVKSFEESQEFSKGLFKLLFEQNDRYPVYVASTAIHQFRQEFESDLYLVGLTYKYCKHNIDNLALIKRNYEKRYLLDYLLHSFSFHSLSKKVNDFNVYYLQGFIKLHQHYMDSEEFESAKKIKKQIISIARKGKKEEILKEWMNEFDH